jgi:lipopolysaccharide transport system permease protein
MLDWRELWAYRELAAVLLARDVKVRYRQAVLGASWAIIRPLFTMIIFSVVFGRLARMPSDGYPYPVFVLAGLLPWTLFSTAITSSGQSLVGSAHLVSKVYFPRLIIPFSSLGSALVDFAVATVLLFALLGWYHIAITWQLMALPLLTLGVTAAALGVGTLLAALTVSFRDFTHLTPFLVQVWMYATPVVFPVSLVPERWKWLLYANPMSGLIEGFRSALLGKPFDYAALATSAGIILIIFVAGVAYFEKVERSFADII